jgi:hypothetical protein
VTGVAPLVLPIGQFFGTFYRSADPADRTHQVRLSGEIRELDEQRFAVWTVLHGIADQLGEQRWTRQAVADLGVGAIHLSVLGAEGLAAEIAPGTSDAEAFARTHRMVRRMVGLGNTATDPGVYTIGYVGRPVVGVTREIYNVWETCDLADSLWGAAAEVAGLTTGGAAGQVLTVVLETVHHLLAMGVVYLEPAG